MELNTNTLNELSDAFGDAFYLLDSKRFQLIRTFRGIYPKFNVAYSYKTNYTPKLVKIVDSLGGFAEVVSDMELEVALRSGVHPKHIIWNGPVKNEEKVKELLLAGGTVNIDSSYELEPLQKISDAYPDHVLSVGLRCNYDVGDGVLSSFGFDVDGEEALSYIKERRNLRLTSLQAHFAKRSPEYWDARTEGMLEVYDLVRENYGLVPTRLDLGGGMYSNMPDSLREQLHIGQVTYKDYADRSASRFAAHFKDAANAPELFVEPGSAVAGDCMRFVTRVKTLKNIRGKEIATCVGSQKNISMSGIIPPMEVIPCGNAQRDVSNVDIAGFTCIESDYLYKNYSGKLGTGDYIVIGNCGSYSVVMKPPFILPNCPVLDITGDRVEVIKRQEYFDDLFHTFSF